MSCGVASRPARRRAGSPFGITWKIRKVRIEMAISNAIADTVRCRMNRTMSVLDAHLRARVQGVADAVAEDVDAQHAEHEHEAGDDRQVDGAGDEADAVADHGSPRRVRILDARAEVREARL